MPKPIVDEEIVKKTAKKKEIYPKKKPTIKKENTEVNTTVETTETIESQEKAFIYPEKKPIVVQKKVDKVVKKSEARPFKVSDGITMMVIDPTTGQKANLSSKNTIMEAYKSKNVVDGKVLYSNNNRLDSNNILKFY